MALASHPERHDYRFVNGDTSSVRQRRGVAQHHRHDEQFPSAATRHARYGALSATNYTFGSPRARLTSIRHVTVTGR